MTNQAFVNWLKQIAPGYERLAATRNIKTGELVGASAVYPTRIESIGVQCLNPENPQEPVRWQDVPGVEFPYSRMPMWSIDGRASTGTYRSEWMSLGEGPDQRGTPAFDTYINKTNEELAA